MVFDNHNKMYELMHNDTSIDMTNSERVFKEVNGTRQIGVCVDSVSVFDITCCLMNPTYTEQREKVSVYKTYELRAVARNAVSDKNAYKTWRACRP